MLKNLYLLILVSICIFAGCKSSNDGVAFSGTPSFDVYDTVTAVPLAANLEIAYPIQTFVFDSVIAVVDMMGHDHFVQLYDQQGRLLKKTAKKGRGPGEIIEFRRCFADKRNGTISFYQPGSITEYDIELILKDSVKCFRHIPVSGNEEGGQPLNVFGIGEDRIFSVGQTADKRFAIQTRGDATVYSDYPAVTERKEFDAAVLNYGETIAFNSDRTLFAKGSYIGGILEIFGIDGKDIVPKSTTYIYEPVYDVVRRHRHDAHVTWGEETTIGFEAVDCSDDYIYTLLNGRKGSELKTADFSDPPFADNISVFGWDGRPVRSVSTGAKLMTVGIRDDSTAYAVVWDNEYALVKIPL